MVKVVFKKIVFGEVGDIRRLDVGYIGRREDSDVHCLEKDEPDTAKPKQTLYMSDCGEDHKTVGSKFGAELSNEYSTHRLFLVIICSYSQE